MKLRLDWQGGSAFCADNGAGHTIIFDGSPDVASGYTPIKE